MGIDWYTSDATGVGGGNPNEINPTEEAIKITAANGGTFSVDEFVALFLYSQETFPSSDEPDEVAVFITTNGATLEYRLAVSNATNGTAVYGLWDGSTGGSVTGAGFTF